MVVIATTTKIMDDLSAEGIESPITRDLTTTSAPDTKTSTSTEVAKTHPSTNLAEATAAEGVVNSSPEGISEVALNEAEVVVVSSSQEESTEAEVK